MEDYNYPDRVADAGALILLSGGVTAVLGTAASVTAIGDRRRCTRLHAWAGANGWRCVEGQAGAGDWPRRFRHLRGFAVRRYVAGEVSGLAVVAAECTHLVRTAAGTGKADRAHDRRPAALSVFVIRLPGAWPDIAVTGREPHARLLERMGRRQAVVTACRREPHARLVGRRQAVTTGDGEFDGRFRVEAFDPSAAAALLTAPVVAAHLSDEVPLWTLQAGELVSIEPRPLRPENVLPAAQRLHRTAVVLGHPRDDGHPRG